MRYCIVYLLFGEAKAAHEKLTAEIADKFGVFRLNGYFPPHITLRRPFETDSIEEIGSLVDKFAEVHSQSTLELKGFNYFRKDVVYVDAFPSLETLKTIEELGISLRTFPGLEFDDFEKELKLHATVAYKDKKIEEKFDEIWDWVSEKNFDFDVELDNISILKKQNNVWILHKQYFLK
ncbi:MAG: hypothetical protein UW30_C0002G0060 [Candidatus Giovannonibacteria bacterium GW2011_GWA2_44_13b]|uniref:2'-5' RNA ligase n=2 Tax=Candidatus Giovannoniibacteriota TaxID=1752738 RepID=A0A0G1K2W7_9BACT|nr:MAG: hypothetical protein UW30_C0002G0060 [Candidatus Giovannonibacteria bacterium GW2011_GWA2_44_13b]OGF81617.1 MAG: hypothetical protein A2924_02640 [Candidatus Giovannonibacteria bacterium RIFCSPLOWO2_01_FULL_44_16]